MVDGALSPQTTPGALRFGPTTEVAPAASERAASLMTRATPALPDPQTAAEAVRAWAATDERLAALLASGLTLGQGVAQWGLQLFRGNRASDAVTAFRAAVALLPGDPDPWSHLGAALDRIDCPAEAAACLERSLALHGEHADNWVLLGLVRLKVGDSGGAEAAYRTALEKHPSLGVAWQCLGLLMEKRRDYGGAIDAFRACAALGDVAAAVWGNLGRLYYQTARVRDARAAYDSAVRGDPTNAHYKQMLRNAHFVCEVLGGASVDAALEAYDGAAADGFGDAPKERLDLLEVAAALLTASGDTDAAVRVCRKRLTLQPSNASARYLLQALIGEPGLDQSPPEYIVESFDAFAEQFDAKLVGVLGYDVPEQLCALVRRTSPAVRWDVALDAGCGTGLCGPLLRPLASWLVGVDLSSKMLERAARRGVYDSLVRDELTAFLAGSHRRFDLIVAADVFIYFGDLARVFALAATAVRPGGLLAVSTELLAAPSHAESGYRVLASGRFAHKPEYVRAAAGEAFVEELCAQTTLRLDAEARVAGNLFLFRARPA